MSSSLDIVIFGSAGVLFILAAILVFRPFRSTFHRGVWITLAIAFIVMASLAGIKTVQHITGTQAAIFELVTGILVLAAALLACVGIYSVGNFYLSDHLVQEAARVELERYRLCFQKEPQMLVIKDRQGTYIATNLAYAQFLGKKDQNLVGESDFNYFPRSQANSFRQEEEKVIESGTSRTREEEMRGIDGVHWFRITRTPLLDESNSIVGTLVSGQDIILQKQAEAALVEWKQGLTTLSEAEMALGEPIELSAARESIITWAGKMAGTSHVGLWQVSPERSVAILKAGCGKMEHSLGVEIRAGEDIVWKVWQSGQAKHINDYQNWPERGQWGQEAGFYAAVGLPLKVKTQVNCVLTMFHDKPGQLFREEQIQLSNLFAQFASSTLQNIERYSVCQDELKERQQTFEKLQYRARLEHVIALIAAHFIILNPDKVDEGISRSLQTIARFTGIDRCYLVLFPREGNSAINIPAWSVNEATSSEESPEDFSGDKFHWYQDKLNQSETIHIPRQGDLSPEVEDAALYLRSRGIKSFTAIPLVANRSVIGYLGLEALRTELEWSQDILSLLKVSAEIFVNLLERKWAAKVAKVAQEKINHQILVLEHSNREGALITEMGDLLQACRTADEAYPIITRFVQRLIPVGTGALYMIHDAKDPAENVAVWGSAQLVPVEHELALNECWALRRGRIYVVQDPTTEPLCGHLKDPPLAGYMCVPLIAQGVAVGVLHLCFPSDHPEVGGFNENQQRLAVKIGEYIAMPLTNLKLRDELRSQAIRDPLTGLFNRRYMEETLEREIRRALRHSLSVGIVMFDIDQLKPINDRFGHDAGDLVLKTLGSELLRMFRGEDVACRFGGDEFTVVLPEASLADVWQRAEQIREAAKRFNLQYEGKQLGTVTLSIGVAAYPDHGLTAERVLQACDAASYAAKSEGRDRIMMGRKTEV